MVLERAHDLKVEMSFEEAGRAVELLYKSSMRISQTLEEINDINEKELYLICELDKVITFIKQKRKVYVC